jgi:hypothetical protein
MKDGPVARFAGRTLAIATIHGKERAIGPAFLRILPLAAFNAIPDVDTDRFGTFSGDVRRTMDPLEACIAKARHGAAVSGADLVCASEGSFGPYPPAPFLTCDEEVLVLYDARDDRVFHHRHVALETVFGGEHCTSVAAVEAFAARMRFPAHGLVLRPQEQWRPGDVLYKGLHDALELRARAEGLIAAHGACWVETDMRAMANPTRMNVIAEAAGRFADELARVCPACGARWFRISSTRSGLPCELCGWPTEGIRAYIRSCVECGHSAAEDRPDGRTTADPRHCPNCNP